jgi:hypothetical protein
MGGEGAGRYQAVVPFATPVRRAPMDSTQILNTRGVDSAGCPDTGGTRNDESEVWGPISSG